VTRRELWWAFRRRARVSWPRLLFLAWVGWRVGEWDAWFKVQTAGWGSTFDWGQSVLVFLYDTLRGGTGWSDMVTAWLIVVRSRCAVVAASDRVWLPMLTFGLVALTLALGQAGYWHSKAAAAGAGPAAGLRTVARALAKAPAARDGDIGAVVGFRAMVWCTHDHHLAVHHLAESSVPELPEVEDRSSWARPLGGRPHDQEGRGEPPALDRAACGRAQRLRATAQGSHDHRPRAGAASSFGCRWIPATRSSAILGMSGQMLVQPRTAPDEKHLHIRFDFTDGGPQLRFVDQRTFGGLRFRSAEPSCPTRSRTSRSIRWKSPL
jgi:hypothetical protein